MFKKRKIMYQDTKRKIDHIHIDHNKKTKYNFYDHTTIDNTNRDKFHPFLFF